MSASKSRASLLRKKKQVQRYVGERKRKCIGDPLSLAASFQSHLRDANERFFFFIAVPLRDFSFPDQRLDWRSNTLFMCTKRGNGNECKVLSFLSRLNSRCPWMARAIKICQYKERKNNATRRMAKYIGSESNRQYNREHIYRG